MKRLTMNTMQTMKKIAKRFAGLVLMGAIFGASSAGLAQSTASLDKMVVAGWSKPITEITNLLVEEDKGFFKARGIALGYVPGAGGGDALRNLLSGQADVAFTDPGSFLQRWTRVKSCGPSTTSTRKTCSMSSH